MLFIKANTLRRFDHLETAIPLFRAVMDRFPRDEVAEYAANLLLDTYNRLQKYDELVALAKELSKNKAFLENRDDLAATVKRIVVQAKIRADHHGHERAPKDPQQFVQEGKEYLDLYNATYGKKVKLTTLKGTDRIVKRIARAEEEFDHGEVAAHFLRNLEGSFEALSPATIERFATLIAAITAALPSQD